MSSGALVQRYKASEVVRAGDMVAIDRLIKPSTYVRRVNPLNPNGPGVGVAMNSANVGDPVDVKIADIENVDFSFVEQPEQPPPAEQSLERIGESLRAIDPDGVEGVEPSPTLPSIVFERAGKEPIELDPNGESWAPLARK